MTSDKKTASLLTHLFVKKGFHEIVLSPGSRNAPLILAFSQHPDISPFSVVDERSAAFFALGMAQQKQRPVAIACTSGSAVLNYAPAIAEAYYQKIPLLVLTADRPPHLIDVGDGQTIRQENVYANYIKKSYSLPLQWDTPAEKEKINRMLNEAMDQTLFPEPGPVHINIPFDEPLYQLTSAEEKGTLVNTFVKTLALSKNNRQKFVSHWQKSRKTLILAGQGQPAKELNNILEKLAGFPQVAVLTETTANLYSPAFLDETDNLLTTLQPSDYQEFQPDLLVTFGTSVVSKKIKKLLRQYPARHHWHIAPSGEKRDTYFCLTNTVKLKAEVFFKEMAPQLSATQSTYHDFCQSRLQRVKTRRRTFVKNTGWCDLKVYDLLFREIPKGTTLHLGNSTPVRYAQLFGSLPQFRYFSNRGVSGIDGQVSTAAGAACAHPHEIHTIITGDLGFFYDSNALMNHHLTPNLKIIVLNNGGGDIFRFIPGPDTAPQREIFFAASHAWKAEKLAEAFGLHYFSAKNEKTLTAVLSSFYAENKRPALLEIFTNEQENARILKDYFQFLAQ